MNSENAQMQSMTLLTLSASYLTSFAYVCILRRAIIFLDHKRVKKGR